MAACGSVAQGNQRGATVAPMLGRARGAGALGRPATVGYAAGGLLSKDQGENGEDHSGSSDDQTPLTD